MDLVSASEKAASPDLVYITRSAILVIQSEAKRHSRAEQSENETGGILVGRRLDGVNRVEILIVAATGPGEGAYHHAVEFNPDVDYVNQRLKEYHAQYPLMDYIGTWHKHPLSYPMFSEGDVRTAHNIFHDPSYKMDEIVNPIVWVDDGNFTIRYYYMSRAMAARGERFVEISQAKVRVIDDNHDLVLKEKGRTAAGSLLERIGEEHRRLAEQGRQVELRQHEQEYFFTVRAADWPGLAIHLVAPAGFPEKAPSLLVEQDGQEIAVNDGGAIGAWSSDPAHSYLVDIVEGVLANLAVPPPLPPASAAPANGQPARGADRPPSQRHTGVSFVAAAGGGALLLTLIGLGIWWFATIGDQQQSGPKSSGTTSATAGRVFGAETAPAQQTSVETATVPARSQTPTPRVEPASTKQVSTATPGTAVATPTMKGQATATPAPAAEPTSTAQEVAPGG